MRYFALIIASLFLLGACQTSRPKANHKPYRSLSSSKKNNTYKSYKRKRRHRRSKSSISKRDSTGRYSLYKSRDLDRRLLRKGKRNRYANSFDMQ